MSSRNALKNLVVRMLQFEQLESRNLLAILLVGPSEPFTSISDAVNAASSGDAIEVVDQGIYRESFTIDKPIALRASGATIEGTVRFEDVVGGVLSGFRITGPFRGVEILDAAPLIVGNHFNGNCHYAEGAAIAVYGDSRSIIADNLITNNETGVANCGLAHFNGFGAIYVGPGAEVVISSNEIRDNWLWWGGAIYVLGDAVIEGNYIHHNSGDYGGGVFAGGNAHVELSHNVISENTSRFQTGAGLELDNSATAFVWNNTIHENTGHQSHPGYGIFADVGVELEAINNIIVFDDFGIHAPGSSSEYYNMFQGGGPLYSGGITAGAGSFEDSPIFVSPATGDFHLADVSPGHHRGAPSTDWSNRDATQNTLGMEGGPATYSLGADLQSFLGDIFSTSAAFFFHPDVLNTEIGWVRTFFGDGPWRENVEGNLIPRTTPLPVGFGSHVNMNEVTLGFLMQAMAAWTGEADNAQAVGLIRTGLTTMRQLQTSDNPDAYHPSGAFYRYETRISREGQPPDQNRRVDELVGISTSEYDWLITSDDNALARRNLTLLKGFVSQLQGAADLIPLIDSIRGDINLRQFLSDDGDSIVFEIVDGVKSSSWDRRAAEGSLIAAEMLDSGEISIELFEHLIHQMEAPTALWDSQSESPALPNPAWPTVFGNALIEDGNFHGAAFMVALRMIHGFPVTAREAPGADYHASAMAPAVQAQLEYALHNNLMWMSSQVMSSELDKTPLVRSPVDGGLHRFPGNDGALCGCGGFSFVPNPRFAIATGAATRTDLARTTAAHAAMTPFHRWREIPQAHLLLTAEWQQEYAGRFWDNRFGFPEALPWRADSNAHAWFDGSGGGVGDPHFTDMGDTFEALGKAYGGIAAFEGLFPDTPLSQFSTTPAFDAAVAGFLDNDTPIDPAIAPSRLQVQIHADSAFEAGAPVSATVRRVHSDIRDPLIVTLQDPSGQLSIPTEITIPAFALEAPFQLSVIDDDLRDGDQTVVVTASASEHQSGSDTIAAIDVEFVFVSADVSELVENAQSTTLTLRRSDTGTPTPLTVALAVDPGGDFSLSATESIPAGPAGLPVTITTIDNALLDGNRDHTIGISSVGYQDGSTTLSVIDHETLTLSVDPGSIHEEDGPNAATLRIQRSDLDDLSQAVQVTLTVPAPLSTPSLTVLLDVGQAERTAPLGVVDNVDQGPSPVIYQVTAQAAGFVGDALTVEVLDEHDDFPYHNWRDPFNVVNDTPAVNLVDVFHVINLLRTAGPAVDLSGFPLGSPPRYPDVVPDNWANLVDAFVSIDNLRNQFGEDGEGEARVGRLPGGWLGEDVLDSRDFYRASGVFLQASEDDLILPAATSLLELQRESHEKYFFELGEMSIDSGDGDWLSDGPIEDSLDES